MVGIQKKLKFYYLIVIVKQIVSNVNYEVRGVMAMKGKTRVMVKRHKLPP